jgi:hypothetical protein
MQRDAERAKLLATTASLRKEVTELRGQQKRLQAQLATERGERRAAEVAERDAAAVRRTLEAACEHAAAEACVLQEEVKRVKASLASRSLQVHQHVQARPSA